MTEAENTDPQSCLSPFLTPLKYIFGQDDNLSPQFDPFYSYNEIESKIKQNNPGTLLRSRPIRVKSFIGLKGSRMQSWHLAYTTTGPLGSEVTVCTVIVPPNAGKRDKIVICCPKTDTANANTRTSWVFKKGNGDPLNASSEQIFIVPFLDRGYIIVVPDYEGQRDAFGCGIISGKATLDAIRVTLSFEGLHLAPRNELRVVVWGYSGGAIAASWAATYLEGYAPDLKDAVVGFAIGGLPANLAACALKINATPTAGLILGIIQGLANAYPTLQEWLDVNLTKSGKEAFQEAKTKNFNSIMIESVQKDILNLTPADHPSFLERNVNYWKMKTNPIFDPLPLKITQENTLLDVFEATNDENLIPKVPVYMYAGIHDNVCPIEPIDTLVSMWKGHGANVEYVRVNFWLHMGLLFANHSETVEWIQDRLDGKEVKNLSGKQGDTIEATRFIADEESSKTLKNSRAEQLKDFFESAFEKTNKLYF